MSLKVAYFIRSFSHFSYHESILNALVQNGNKVTIYFDRHWSRNGKVEYLDSWIKKNNQPERKFYPIRKDSYRILAFSLREFITYLNYLLRKDQSAFYAERWVKHLHKNLQKICKIPILNKIFLTISKSKIVYSLLRYIEKSIPACPNITAKVSKIDCDIAVLSPINLRFSNEVDILRALKLRKIPTILSVLSWDNLTTKGILHELPDLVFAWNKSQFQEAVDIHRVSKNKILVTGSPYFDKWFSTSDKKTLSRTQFCQKVGLDPNRPFITYLGSSINIAKDETWVIEKIADQLEKSNDPYLNSLQILLRPHPSNFNHYLKLNISRITLWPKPPFRFLLGVPEKNDEIEDLHNSLTLPQLVIGINTSSMLEAVINNKKVLAIELPEYNRTQRDAIHFKHLKKSGAIICCNTIVDLINKISNDKDDKSAKKRFEFTRNFVRPHGLEYSAGNIQANAIQVAAKDLTLKETTLDIKQLLKKDSHPNQFLDSSESNYTHV